MIQFRQKQHFFGGEHLHVWILSDVFFLRNVTDGWGWGDYLMFWIGKQQFKLNKILISHKNNHFKWGTTLTFCRPRQHCYCINGVCCYVSITHHNVFFCFVLFMVFIHFRVNYYQLVEFAKNILKIVRNFIIVELFIYSEFTSIQPICAITKIHKLFGCWYPKL